MSTLGNLPVGGGGGGGEAADGNKLILKLAGRSCRPELSLVCYVCFVRTHEHLCFHSRGLAYFNPAQSSRDGKTALSKLGSSPARACLPSPGLFPPGCLNTAANGQVINPGGRAGS